MASIEEYEFWAKRVLFGHKRTKPGFRRDRVVTHGESVGVSWRGTGLEVVEVDHSLPYRYLGGTQASLVLLYGIHLTQV